MEGAHGLGGQVAAPDDVVVHDPAQAMGLALAVHPVLPVHQGGEHGSVGHLAGGAAGLHLGGPQELLHLRHQQLLAGDDELGALVVGDVRVVEGLLLLVLGVPAAGVGALEQAGGPGGGHLRGDQVDALLLPPDVVLRGPGEQLLGLAHVVGDLAGAGGLRLLVQDGAGVGRGVLAHVAGGDDGGDPFAPDVHLHLELGDHMGLQVGQADGALGGFVGDDGLDAGALSLKVGDHGAGGDVAQLLAVAGVVDGEARPENAPAQQADGVDAVG